MSPAAGRNLAVMLTPSGSGAIAAIRLSGIANDSFANLHLSRSPKPGRCVHADLRNGDEVIDDVVVVQSENGVLDLNLHGGPYVTQAVLRLVECFGYAIGQWSQDAVVAFDSDDEIERQMLVDLPLARSETVLRLLTAQPSKWRTMLVEADRAAMEAAVADLALERALAIPNVAIVGPPNVGKSTLANALFGQHRSITAGRPGTTRDWVGELANLSGLVVRLIDTPGVRETADPIEAQAIRQAGNVIGSADCVIVALDGSRPVDEAERILLDRWQTRNPIVVRTKADRPVQCEVAGIHLNVSARTGQRMTDLVQLIHHRLGVADLASLTARCWTEEQRYKLRSILHPAGR